MKTYNSLQDIFNDAGTHQVTAQELLNGRSHVCGKWQEIKLTDELRREICHTLSEMYGGRTATKQRVFRNLMHERRQHWGLQRTVIFDYGKGAHLTYIAGQDQVWENNEIRKALKQ